MVECLFQPATLRFMLSPVGGTFLDECEKVFRLISEKRFPVGQCARSFSVGANYVLFGLFFDSLWTQTTTTTEANEIADPTEQHSKLKPKTSLISQSRHVWILHNARNHLCVELALTPTHPMHVS